MSQDDPFNQLPHHLEAQLLGYSLKPPKIVRVKDMNMQAAPITETKGVDPAGTQYLIDSENMEQEQLVPTKVKKQVTWAPEDKHSQTEGTFFLAKDHEQIIKACDLLIQEKK